MATKEELKEEERDDNDEDNMDRDTLLPQFYDLDETFIPKWPLTKKVLFHSIDKDESRRCSIKKVYKRTTGIKYNEKIVVELELDSNEEWSYNSFKF